MSETEGHQSVYHKNKSYDPEKEELVNSRDLPLPDQHIYPEDTMVKPSIEHKTSNTSGMATSSGSGATPTERIPLADITTQKNTTTKRSGEISADSRPPAKRLPAEGNQLNDNPSQTIIDSS
jgi:hypothetical protein